HNFLNVTAGGLTAALAGIVIVVDGTGAAFDPSQSYSYQVGAFTGSDLSGVSVTNPSQFTAVGFGSSSFTFSLTGNSGGALFLNLTPVPEPATALGLAAVGL